MLFRKENKQISDNKLNMDGSDLERGSFADHADYADSASFRDRSTPTAAQLRRAMHRQIFMIMLCVVVSGLSAGAYISRAWFASNREVKSDSSSITSGTPTPSLFIRPGDTGTKTRDYATSVSREMNVSLFPSSTDDLENWYYASSFKFGTYEISSSGTGGAVSYTEPSAPVASDFKLVTTSGTTDDTRITESGNAGTYENSLEKETKTAYYYAEDNLYTSNGALDVYLAPENPIDVTLKDESQSKEDFMKAVRVGIECGSGSDRVMIIYAPVAESDTSKGNTDGDSTDTGFKAIGEAASGSANSWEMKTLSDLHTASIADYKAGKSGDVYTAGTTRLCQATSEGDGVDVKIYIWLEGTDGKALIGYSDSDSYGINVSINYVGVSTDGTSGT